MATKTYTGLEFIGGFALLAGALWLIGALLVGGLVLMGQDRVAGTPNDSNQTAVGEMPTQ